MKSAGREKADGVPITIVASILFFLIFALLVGLAYLAHLVIDKSIGLVFEGTKILFCGGGKALA